MSVLQEIDAERGYLDFDHTSLFAYAVSELKLSESTALNFINVARKAVHVPALKQEIADGSLGVATARKIVPVLTPDNQDEWIEKAKTLTTRNLEKEVARIAPQAAQPERVRYVSENRLNLSLSLDEKNLEALKRVQDLESQRLERAVSLEETLAAMSAFYLEKKDPVEKAKRIEAKTGPQASDVTGQARQPAFRRRPLPAALEWQVLLRDGGQCTHKGAKGLRCTQRRWLQVHHIQLLSEGGADRLENLTTLCFAHHRMQHRTAG